MDVLLIPYLDPESCSYRPLSDVVFATGSDGSKWIWVFGLPYPSAVPGLYKLKGLGFEDEDLVVHFG